MTTSSTIRLPVSRRALVAEARRWIDTPWARAGAQRGIGANCMGFLCGAARDAGLTGLWDVYAPHQGLAVPEYPRGLVDALLTYLVRLPVRLAEPGDVLLFDLGDGERHVGLITEPGFIIHAHQAKGGVVEHRNLWPPRRAFSIPGVH